MSTIKEIHTTLVDAITDTKYTDKETYELPEFKHNYKYGQYDNNEGYTNKRKQITSVETMQKELKRIFTHVERINKEQLTTIENLSERNKKLENAIKFYKELRQDKEYGMNNEALVRDLKRSRAFYESKIES